MFRVLCINGTDPEAPHLINPIDWIVEGRVYTVLAIKRVNGQHYYILDEKVEESGRVVLYRTDRFILLEDQEQEDNGTTKATAEGENEKIRT